jgi:hypothetical protein
LARGPKPFLCVALCAADRWRRLLRSPAEDPAHRPRPQSTHSSGRRIKSDGRADRSGEQNAPTMLGRNLATLSPHSSLPRPCSALPWRRLEETAEPGRRAPGASPATAPPQGGMAEPFSRLPPCLSEPDGSMRRRPSPAVDAPPVTASTTTAGGRPSILLLFSVRSARVRWSLWRPRRRRATAVDGGKLFAPKGSFPFGCGGGKLLHCPSSSSSASACRCTLDREERRGRRWRRSFAGDPVSSFLYPFPSFRNYG